MSPHFPVFAICGYSGSGKTTIVEQLIRHFSRQGLCVAVIKHDAHGPSVDTPGKDSDRFFKAGANVLLNASGEHFFRAHTEDRSLEAFLAEVCPSHDLVLVEGHKTTAMPRKLWLLSEGETAPPETAGHVQAVLGREEDRYAIASRWIEAGLKETWLSTPVRAGILAGGQARRMGQPKHLIRMGDETWIERTVRILKPFAQDVVLLGQADIPQTLNTLTRLPDVPDRRGPLAGMLSAMRWDPTSHWIFAGCDMPQISPEAIGWLLGTRQPGVWATLPRLEAGGPVEPLLGYYDFRARTLLENCQGPSELAGRPRIISPLVPAELASAWRNVNTPEELARL